jgi:hypothetical protein
MNRTHKKMASQVNFRKGSSLTTLSNMENVARNKGLESWWIASSSLFSAFPF